MTAVLSSPTGASSPVRWDSDWRADRVVRLGAGLAMWAGLLAVTYWWVRDGGITDLSAWDTGLTSLGRLSGLWSADLLLVQVLLMARLPPLEHAFGRDRLTATHRLVGFASFDLMLVHVVTIIGGYAGARWSAVPRETWDLLTSYGGVLLAAAGSACLVLVALTSIKMSRRRLRYESWHLLHLYAYLGVGLALPHQLWTGQEFLVSRAATLYWWGLWIAAAGAILAWRVVLPLTRSLRHRLVVTAVVRESSDVVSVHLGGRALDRLPLRAGQFLNVRFLSGTGWTRANPFSVSAAPDGFRVRITAKALGEGSARLAHLRPGTRVLFEGPYGRLSSRVRTRPRVLLAGAGVGITPIRSLAEGLDYAPGEAVLLQRFTAEPLFVDELAALGAGRGLLVGALPGPRTSPTSVLGPTGGPDECATLLRWMPDLAERDVFLCGPSSWTRSFELLLAAAGVDAEQIHTESFGW